VTIRVEVVHALPEEQHVLPLELDDHAVVADALAVAATDLVFSRFALAALTIAIWGSVVDHSHQLRDGDRIELLRPLLVDPKEARRRRARRLI
jgi:putative ubiquitin-RnfH superfamily antitoxin RatB of RatAB toxin-antitoxin module